MAHPNEHGFLKQFLQKYPSNEWLASLDGARVLNVGAARYEGYQPEYAALFPDRNLLGIDQQAGDGVDQVCDITGDCAALTGEQFAAILCCSVLEHCERPWVAAANLERHLLPYGLLYVTVPWIWRYHSYPKDYWRISADGIRLLFPSIRWKRIAYMTQAPFEIVPDAQRNDPPWRVKTGARVSLVTQMVCMIGRKT